MSVFKFQYEQGIRIKKLPLAGYYTKAKKKRKNEEKKKKTP